MKHEQPTLQTDRLILRPFRIEDAPVVQVLAGDERIYRTTLNIPHPYEDGVAEKWIARHLSDFLEEKAVHFAIQRREDGRLLGAVGLMRQARHNRAELGYFIGVDFWSNGYCTEAARAVVAYGFDVLGLHRIFGEQMESNPASGRVLEKLGMQPEGRKPDHIRKDDRYETILTWGMLAAQWQTRA
jgi:RimJ/RimL family protein N-acetyltransferase